MLKYLSTQYTFVSITQVCAPSPSPADTRDSCSSLSHHVSMSISSNQVCASYQSPSFFHLAIHVLAAISEPLEIKTLVTLFYTFATGVGLLSKCPHFPQYCLRTVSLLILCEYLAARLGSSMYIHQFTLSTPTHHFTQTITVASFPLRLQTRPPENKPFHKGQSPDKP